MRVLILGAGGFLGGGVVSHLKRAGHEVICAGRDPIALGRRFGSCAAIHAELRHDTAEDWLPRLTGIDAVVNAAGLLRGDLAKVHHEGAVALFDACAKAHIRHVLQISALGAGAQPGSLFLRTKHAADEHFLRLAQERSETGWGILRPSLIIGRGGRSTGLFLSLAAALPIPLRLGRGTWQVQPLHVDDFADLVARLLSMDIVPQCLDVVGPAPMTTDALTALLRAWLGLPPRPYLTVPTAAMRLFAWCGSHLPGASLTQESLAMLEAGSIAESEPIREALGWMPRDLVAALTTEPATQADLWQARLEPLRPLMLIALYVIWLGSGFVSALLPAVSQTVLLAGLGLAGWQAGFVTALGSALDVTLGLALLSKRWRSRAAIIQIAAVGLYTVLATVALPGLWLDPFAPLLKNLAVVVTALALLATEA